MPRYDDDEDDDWEADEFDDDDFGNDEFGNDADEDTIPCPHCGREVHEEAERCPHCETYLSEEDATPTRKPWWIYLGVVVCLYLVYRWIVG